LASKGPDSPTDLANEPSITNESQIGLSWNEGAYDGGSPVIDYTLSINDGTGFVVLVSGLTETSYTAPSLTAC